MKGKVFGGPGSSAQAVSPLQSSGGEGAVSSSWELQHRQECLLLSLNLFVCLNRLFLENQFLVNITLSPVFLGRPHKHLGRHFPLSSAARARALLDVAPFPDLTLEKNWKCGRAHNAHAESQGTRALQPVPSHLKSNLNSKQEKLALLFRETAEVGVQRWPCLGEAFIACPDEQGSEEWTGSTRCRKESQHQQLWWGL